MSIVRRTPVDTDRKKLLADLAARPQSSEEHIDRWAEEDGGAMTDEELAQAVPVYPPPKPEDVRPLRARLELSQSQFALMFGFSVDTVQQYEQGRRGSLRSRVNLAARDRERAGGHPRARPASRAPTFRRPTDRAPRPSLNVPSREFDRTRGERGSSLNLPWGE
jgi:DNA-binding transcriptional regulator YiaG